MIAGNIVMQHMGFGVMEQPNGKLLVLKDMDSGLTIQLPFSLAEFDRFVTNLKTDKIVQATVIPHEQIKTIEKIREG